MTVIGDRHDRGICNRAWKSNSRRVRASHEPVIQSNPSWSEVEEGKKCIRGTSEMSIPLLSPTTTTQPKLYHANYAHV